MDQQNGGVLKLLQDIKELLLGIALLLSGGILTGLGFVLADLTGTNAFLLFSVAGLVFLPFGGLHVWCGWTAHHVVEKDQEMESAEP